MGAAEHGHGACEARIAGLWTNVRSVGAGAQSVLDAEPDDPPDDDVEPDEPLAGLDVDDALEDDPDPVDDPDPEPEDDVEDEVPDPLE